jgi:hypothetical protein
VKRHPSFKALSAEHHLALVLARALRPGTAPELRGGLPAGGAALLDAVTARWTQELAPHFAIEERELLGPSQAAGPELHAHAQRIVAEHAQLRALFEGLTAHSLVERGAELGSLLEAHVRFEERSWFPALEAALDAQTLDRLTLRLKREPESRIAGYHQDEQGLWVAELDCGHARHVRHQPPFQLAEWVTTAAGRRERLGWPMVCVACRRGAPP